MNIEQEIAKQKEYIVQMRRRFHQYPELACEEFTTTKLLIEELEAMDIPYDRISPTGVVGYLGKGTGKTIALRADIDGLRVTEETGLSFSSKIQGQMHACGHDGHIAALLGAARVLKEHEEQLNGRIKLIFQPAEEISLGAAKVMEQGFLDDVEEMFGVHIFSDIPAGRVSIEAGARMAATDHFTITIKGKAGHAAKPHQCIDATIVAAALAMNLQTIISRQINPLDSAVLTIGRLQSGTAYNVISGEAVLEGTVRTFDVDTENKIKEQIIQMAKTTAALYGAQAEVDYPPSVHPPLNNDAAIAKRIRNEAKAYFSEEALAYMPPIMLGEDFSNYQERVPGVFAFVGGGKNDGSINYLNHHSKFDFEERALLDAAKLHLIYVRSVCR